MKERAREQRFWLIKFVAAFVLSLPVFLLVRAAQGCRSGCMQGRVQDVARPDQGPRRLTRVPRGSLHAGRARQPLAQAFSCIRLPVRRALQPVWAQHPAPAGHGVPEHPCNGQEPGAQCGRLHSRGPGQVGPCDPRAGGPALPLCLSCDAHTHACGTARARLPWTSATASAQHSSPPRAPAHLCWSSQGPPGQCTA